MARVFCPKTGKQKKKGLPNIYFCNRHLLKIACRLDSTIPEGNVMKLANYINNLSVEALETICGSFESLSVRRQAPGQEEWRLVNGAAAEDLSETEVPNQVKRLLLANKEELRPLDAVLTSWISDVVLMGMVKTRPITFRSGKQYPQIFMEDSQTSHSTSVDFRIGGHRLLILVRGTKKVENPRRRRKVGNTTNLQSQEEATTTQNQVDSRSVEATKARIAQIVSETVGSGEASQSSPTDFEFG